MNEDLINNLSDLSKAFANLEAQVSSKSAQINVGSVLKDAAIELVKLEERNRALELQNSELIRQVEITLNLMRAQKFSEFN